MVSMPFKLERRRREFLKMEKIQQPAYSPAYSCVFKLKRGAASYAACVVERSDKVSLPSRLHLERMCRI